jgi:hypothetical protein
MGKLNYRRGLVRTYIVLAALWIAAIFIDAVAERPKADIFDVAAGGPSGSGYWIPHIAVALLPPTIGYVALFLIVPWIARGFRRE